MDVAACEQGRTLRYVPCAQLVNEIDEAADKRRLSRILSGYWRLVLLPHEWATSSSKRADVERFSRPVAGS